MKKILIGLLVSVSLFSCSQQEMAKNYGGTVTINLETGERLINITWKESDIWYLVKKDTTIPQTYEFKNSSDWGFEGKVIIVEQ